MATPFRFERRFDRQAAPVIAGAARPRCGPAADAVPFAPPLLGRPSAADAAEPAEQQPSPAPTFSEAELCERIAAAVAEAEAATAARVRAELEDSIAARQAAALERLANDLAAHRAALEQALAERAAASRDLALALARALVPRALERQPLADIEAMLRDLVGRLEDQPRLTLVLPPELVEDGRRLLEQVATEAGWRGELLVEPDATLGPGDARLKWAGGSAERDLAALEREAIALVDAWLPPESAPAGLTDPTDPTTDVAVP